MNLADQIDHIARRATDEVVAASHVFAATQRCLAEELADREQSDPAPDLRLRSELERQADAADSSTPRILLPADAAEASPHHRADGE